MKKKYNKGHKLSMCSDVVVASAKACEVAEPAITRIEVKADDDGGLLARINGKGKWKSAEFDEYKMKLTVKI